MPAYAPEMYPPKESIEEFRVIYAKECGKIIEEEEAREMASRLINLYLIIYSPLPGEHSGRPTPPLADSCDDHDASFPNPE